MRFAFLLSMSCLTGCVLYSAEEDPLPEPPIDDEGPPIEPTFCEARMWCEAGTVVRSPPVASSPGEACPDPARIEVVRTCEYGCRPVAGQICGAVPCDEALADELCYEPLPPARCADDGAVCTSEGVSEGCPAESLCGGVVPVGECTCTGGAWACEEACDRGLCGPDAVTAALVGTWRGFVIPPTFSQPYAVTLELRADGTYVATCGASCDLVFYYGENGTSREHRWRIIGQTTVGAIGAIGIVFQPGNVQDGALDSLRIDGDRLTFRFWASWGGCTQPFAFDLQRQGL